MHQLPAEPAYLRVKVLRRLKALGARPIKNSAYVLPDGDAAREDFQWLRREIVDGGGEATVSVATFLEGVSDTALENEFSAERNEEYDDLVAAATAAVAAQGPKDTELARLRRRFQAIADRDYFEATGRFAAVQALAEIEARLRGHARGGSEPVNERPEGATWVTRSGVRIDRVASAWLIRGFIDAGARFRFVAPEGYVPESGELRFDMFEGEFTHEGGNCTFETLLNRFRVDEPELTTIAEIVHDIDCKDEKYGRPETAGIASLIAGVVAAHARDEDRIAAASPVFDALLAGFRSGRTRA
jgi:hypothetical protein